MQHIQIKTAGYRHEEERFKRWLGQIGMAEQAQSTMPLHVREYLHFMEQREVTDVSMITVKDTQDYFAHLLTRANQRRGGGLSKSYYNKQLQAIKKYSKYRWQHEKILLSIPIKRQKKKEQHPEILTKEEVQKLYEATTQDRKLQLRDEAILDIYYSAGLRRREGEYLQLEDLQLERRIIHVRHGKNYTERYVPITKSVAKRLKTYIDWTRQDLLGGNKEQAMLISSRGRKMEGQSMLVRIKKLQERSDSEVLKKKNIGLHTLRHSIATHLLQSGMPLKQIAKYLGHRSIESTQIYTHLIHEI